MANNIHLLDPKIYEVRFGGQKYNSRQVKTVEQWCKEYDADLCFNLGLFNMQTGEGYTFVRNEDGDFGYGGKSEDVYVNALNGCRGYSDAIKFGNVIVNYPLGGKRTRNGIGVTIDGWPIIAQSSHATYEQAFAKAVNEYVIKQGKKVKFFVLQDGGGSTSEWSNRAKLGFYPEGTRRVATVTCVYFRNLPPITRNLSFGKRRDDVKKLQIVLGGLEVDGIFGLGTRKRLMAAQKALGLKADGSCGPLTRRALGIGG